MLGGAAAPREHPPLHQSVTSHPTMKPPSQVGNGENYPSFDSLIAAWTVLSWALAPPLPAEQAHQVSIEEQ